MGLENDFSSDLFIGPIKTPHYTDEPKFPEYFSKFNETQNLKHDFDKDLVYGYGISEDEEESKNKSMGECIERFCLFYPCREFCESSFYEFGHKFAIDPFRFVNYKVKEGNKKELADKLRGYPFSWLKAKSELKGHDVYIPAQTATLYPLEEPVLREPISTGAAYSLTKEKALERGLLESIERDAFMISYLSKRDVYEVDLDTDETKSIKDYFGRYLLEPRVFDLTTDLGIPTVTTILKDITSIGPSITISASSSYSPENAVRRSLLEAQQSRVWLRHQYELSPNWNPDSEEIIDAESRSIYWSRRENAHKLDFWLKNSDTRSLKSWENGLSRSRKMDFQSLVGLLSGFGMEPLSVDLTPHFVQGKTMKAIVPELHPLYLNEDLASLDSKRLNKYLGNKKLNKVPHPFN